MKLKFLFDYLSYAAPAFAFSLLAKLFSFLSKKCSALALRAKHLLEKQQTKLEELKAKRMAAALRDDSADGADEAERDFSPFVPTAAGKGNFFARVYFTHVF